ncbi:MAG: hypothetical protein ACXQTW_07215 [Candidatus Methanospirareceae archaeon]
MTIEFRYREEESEITGRILRPVAVLEFKSRDGEWVDIRIDDVEFPIDVAWALEEDVPPLLGRTDVFDRFKIMFNQGSRSIIFEDVDDLDEED